MTHPSFNPRKPAGFIISDSAQVARKLRDFATAGPEKMYYLFDFDRTLTTSKHTGKDITTWQILHGLLPEEGKRKSTAIRTKYLAMEAAGLLSAKDTRQWSAAELKLHGMHGTSLQEVEQAARQIKLRDGTHDLFAACEQAAIPTVILSAGVRDVIEVIADEHRIKPTIILSIKLVVSEDGRVIGWQRGSMIHTLNKREKGNRELARLRQERPLAVLVGDTIEDAHMVDGDDSVLRIRVCDVFKEDLDNPVDYLQQSFNAGYDMVIEGNLQPVVALTKWLSNPEASE
jgi:HAD superfamily phosphoserine phosphatase-like hydrolase